jgi:hypothetical protein
MSTKKNSLNSQNDYVPSEMKLSKRLKPFEKAVADFVEVYNSRAIFFTHTFIKKVKDGNRKALAELQGFSFPPTQMDLRKDLERCVKAGVPDSQVFVMKDGGRYLMSDLRRNVTEWALLAEKALIDSDPLLADKLMSSVQWNAKAAFEVTFASAMNELKDIKKTKHVAGADHYMKWIVNPLKKAIENVKLVKPPGNSLIGYGDRLPLTEAVALAETLPAEFEKLFKTKK